MSRWLCLVCCIVYFGSSFVLAGNYSEGIKAYMNGDYELSQISWLKAAKENDAKAMFNLGLLHEQERLNQSNQNKAEKWYRLAGKHGYAAADYHLARRLLLSYSGSKEAIDLLNRASTKGFFPAKTLLQRLQSSTEVVTAATPVTEQKSVKTKTIAEPYLTEHSLTESYLTEEWINLKSSSSWTIQVLAFQEKSKVRAFIDQHKLHQQAAYFEERHGNNRLFKLIYGSYSSKEKADQARQKLPAELKQHGPWLRTIASVKGVIQSK